MFGLLIGMTALGAAVGLLAYLVLGRARPAVVASGGDVPVTVTGASAATNQTSALRKRLMALAAKLSGSGYTDRVQARLDKAGNPKHWDVQRLLALKGTGLIAGLILGLLVGAKSGGTLTLLAPAVGGALGLFLPDMWLRNLGEHRQVDLRRGLPDGLDMMTVCVEAGLGFDAALSKVARNLEGPFPDECARVLQEMQIGRSRAEALRAMSQRTDVPELTAFVTALVQSSELGISVGDVLREQAVQMRIKRRQNAEERAQKLQVKLLFPLIFCLLPAMFIVVLGPAALQIIGFFQKAGN